MTQTRKHSVLETVANIGVGYVVAVTAQVYILPAFGVSLPLGDNLAIGAFFTVVSLVRSYALRRVFNMLA